MTRTPRCLVDDVDAPTPNVDADMRRHLERSLRMRDGESVELVDGRGGWARATWQRGGTPVVVDRAPRAPCPADTISLAIGAPRLPRLEWLVEKAAELGVADVIPIETEHAERTPGRGRLERLRRKAASALLQSRGLHALAISEATSLDAALARGWDTIWLGSTPDDAATPPPPARGRLLIVVGPEGGLTSEEHAAVETAGGQGVTIGPAVLRVETAAIALAALSYHLR